jgi:hypothetical protein
MGVLIYADLIIKYYMYALKYHIQPYKYLQLLPDT